MLDVRQKAETLRPSRRIKVWLAYMMTKSTTPVFTDHRPDQLIIRNVQGYRNETALQYGKGGKLKGDLELVVDANGKVLSHKLISDPSRKEVPIDALRVSVTKINSMKEDTNEDRDECYKQTYRESYPSPSVFKVVIGESGDYDVFTPIRGRPFTPNSLSNVHIRPSDVPREVQPQHWEFMQKIIGIHLEQFPSSVLVFRKRERKEDIKFPFQAAVWLESQIDTVPVPLTTFVLIVIWLFGVVLPFVLLAVPQAWWDRWDRALSISGYSLGLLSFRELLVTEGYATTNVLKGFVRPDKLSNMASALGISVSELLFLARMGGSWTTNLDASQLNFLGLYGGGNIRRDEWKEMNQYAVGDESFNKQYMLTRNGVGTIFGTAAQKGGRVSTNVEERGVMAPPFLDFDECKHYLS